VTATRSQTATYQPQTDERFLLVHGWNMPEWEKKSWAATVFKRLWWQRYKGSVALFDWPTMHGFGEGNWWDIAINLRHFDNSEFIAWRSSDALVNVFSHLNSGGQLRVLAHSMGNVVMTEALRKCPQGSVHTYIADKAAVSAQYYDGTVASRESAKYKMSNPSTPDIMGHFASGLPDAPSYAGNFVIWSAANRFNYHNYDDFALKKWETNNEFKPDYWGGYTFGYWGETDSYSEGPDRFYRETWFQSQAYHFLSLAYEVERHMIFSYCAESRSKALGQAKLGVDGFTGFDLNDVLEHDDSHYSHSREFRSNVADEWRFWERVFGDCDFEK
jgi:Alpha/beta hydrolase of unknown function (DUF900).